MMKKIIKNILVLLWMGLIFYFSSRDNIDSTKQSQSIVNKTNIVNVYEEKANVDKETALENVDRIFRKIAHGVEYMVLGILLCIALSEHNLSLKKIIIISIFICICYSITDEVHQLYVSGRSGEVRDVIIDSIGSLFGIIGYVLVRRRIL